MQKCDLPRIQQHHSSTHPAQDRCRANHRQQITPQVPARAATEVNCPGHSATVFVAFAWIGAIPIDNITGNEINDPPPAIAFITPAINEAMTSQK